MARIIGVFQTQSGADTAMEELARLDPEHVRTAVYEGHSQDNPDGADSLEVGNRAGPAAIPIPVPATGRSHGGVLFGNLGLELGEGENEEFLRQMYENGATLVVVDGDEDQLQQARRILHMHGARFSNES